jgi:hypothetical protein
VHERVEVGEVDAVERASDREALALEARRRAVIDLTGRWREMAGSGSWIRGRTVMSSTVIAGMRK